MEVGVSKNNEYGLWAVLNCKLSGKQFTIDVRYYVRVFRFNGALSEDFVVKQNQMRVVTRESVPRKLQVS